MMLSRERIEELQLFEEKITYSFQDQLILNTSLTHKSYSNEIDSQMQDNERLEFLGDAVIDLIISEHFFKKFPLRREGDLTKLRAAIVNENTLARISREIGLGDFILLGKGEEYTAGRNKPSILGDALEAVMAAVYLDGGLENASRIILRLFKSEIERITFNLCFGDFKSELQERTQEKLNCIPVYRVVKEIGPPHDKDFEVEVMIKGEILGLGKGKNKKEAEQSAAQEALPKLTNGSRNQKK